MQGGLDVFADAIAEWAAARADVHAAVVLGSQARENLPADEWSDLDVDVVVDDSARAAEDVGWLRDLGPPLVTFVEQTPLGHRRRVLYETGEELDLTFLPLAVVDRLESSSDYATLLARGFRVLTDEIGLEERLRAHAERAVRPASPTRRDFDHVTADFWYHAIWTAKKLRRGEVFTARACLYGHLRTCLVTLLEWHARSNEPDLDTWHEGRHLERWADPAAVALLASEQNDPGDLARTLWETIGLWARLEEETAARLELELVLERAELEALVADLVPDPRP